MISVLCSTYSSLTAKHGTTYFLTAKVTLSVTAKLTLSRHNLLSHGKSYSFTHGKTYSFTAQLTRLTLSRQKLIFHSRQNLLFDGTTNFLTAKVTLSITAKPTLSRHNVPDLLSHGKNYSFTAQLTFSPQNVLTHNTETFTLLAKLTIQLAAGGSVFSRRKRNQVDLELSFTSACTILTYVELLRVLLRVCQEQGIENATF